MSNRYRGNVIDASYQVSVHLAKRFQRRRLFSNRPISNKNCLWLPCLLTNQNEISTIFHRCYLPSFGSFGQTVAEENIFRNRPIRNKNCMWRLCLLMNRAEISILHRGPSIYASYHALVHLAKRFQRRFFYNSTNQKQ